MICNVCKTNEAIGVASTSIPYSCAYCATCAQHGADPEEVFVFLYDEVGGAVSQVHPGLTTYKNGKYMSFEEWAKIHETQERTS